MHCNDDVGKVDERARCFHNTTVRHRFSFPSSQSHLILTLLVSSILFPCLLITNLSKKFKSSTRQCLSQLPFAVNYPSLAAVQSTSRDLYLHLCAARIHFRSTTVNSVLPLQTSATCLSQTQTLVARLPTLMSPRTRRRMSRSRTRSRTSSLSLRRASSA